MLAVADAMLRNARPDDGRRVIGTDVPGLLEREVVAAHHFHRQLDVQHVLAMFGRRWLQLPAELAGHPKVVDLSAEFHDIVGVRLRDFVAVGIALYAHVRLRGPSLPPDLFDHLDQLDVDPASTARIVSLISAPVAALRGWACDEGLPQPWKFDHLERFPLLDCGDHFLVLRPGLLLQRFFGWLPIFDIEASLGRGRAAQRRLDRIKGCLGQVSEAYARETLETQVRRHGWRLYDEDQLRAVLQPSRVRRTGRGGLASRTCDLTVDDGHRWALFEVTSSHLTRQSVAGTSAQRLHDDLEKLVGKVEQLDDTITNLRRRETDLTGSPADPARRSYHPVLVLTEGFPVNPVTLTMLRQRAEQAGFLRGADTRPLEVVEVTELEILEGAGLGELTLLDALAAKSRARLFRASLRDFLLRECELDATTPLRVQQHAQVVFDIAASEARSTGAA
jgi:hypothetical protein